MLQQKLATRDGASIDRNHDIERLWEFYQRFKRRHRVEDMQKEEQRLRESGTFSANIKEYDHGLLLGQYTTSVVLKDACAVQCII